MAIHFHHGDGRRQWPEQGIEPPKTERQKREYDKLYYNVPGVPKPAERRAPQVISSSNQRLKQADAHAAQNERYQLYYAPHTDGRRGGVVRPVQQAAASAPQRAVEPEPTKLPKKVIDDLVRKFGEPMTSRALEEAGLDTGFAPADAHRLEAISLEEAGHAIQGDTLGLRAHDIFLTRSGSGQYTPNDQKALKRSGDDWRETLKRMVSLYIAGGIAQKIKFGRVLYPSAVDAKVIDEYLVVAGNERAEVLAEAEQYTEAVLRLRWSEVEAVAVALREHGTLRADAFYKLITPVTPTVQVRKEMLPMMTRSAAASFDEAAGTIQVVWGTGARVKRSSYNGLFWEDLPVENANLEYMNSGRCAFLDSHNNSRVGDILGVVQANSAFVKEGKGYATIVLGSRAPIADIKSGAVANLSIGYSIDKVRQLPAGDDNIPIMRVEAYTIKEVSAVGIGADPGALIRKYQCEWVG